MNLPKDQRSDLPAWSAELEYVNGGLFAGTIDAPVFDVTAYRYLRDACNEDWREINPDIFGSMIQSVADPKQRSELGMHYTSVPNIMKVIGPLFLDDLDAEIEKAWDRPNGLRKVLTRIEGIRVFDPACGSGNFLVVSYRQLREREMRILERLEALTGESTKEMFSAVQIANFHGIEITDFAAETAKLALFIAEYQANAVFREVFGQGPASLPLRESAHIVCGNALRMDWEEVCPPPIEGEEVFIAGNPPYLGKGKLTDEQKADMALVFGETGIKYGYVDFVGAWFLRGAQYCEDRAASLALVATNSVGQGRQAPVLWPCVLDHKVEFSFVHTSFKWANNAARKAAVFCVIVGLRPLSKASKYLFSGEFKKEVSNITAYFTEGKTIYVPARTQAISGILPEMNLGNKANDDGNLIFSPQQYEELLNEFPQAKPYLRRYLGSKELNNGKVRYCLWLKDEDIDFARTIEPIRKRLDDCRDFRSKSTDGGNQQLAERPHQMRERNEAKKHTLFVSIMTSQKREYLPTGFEKADAIMSGQAFAVYDAEDWVFSLTASKMHFVWVAAICGQLKEDYRYSNDLGWNTFPVPNFSKDQLETLNASARKILKTRYSHYPATIADLYDPDKMPGDLREAHRENDELLEAMYIGRPFRNDTERLEHLFKLYASKQKLLKKR